MPADLIAVWLPRELPSLATRTDAGALLAWVIGRGEAPPLAPWHGPERRAGDPV
jgi:hypothetical protein